MVYVRILPSIRRKVINQKHHKKILAFSTFGNPLIHRPPPPKPLGFYGGRISPTVCSNVHGLYGEEKSDRLTYSEDESTLQIEVQHVPRSKQSGKIRQDGECCIGK